MSSDRVLLPDAVHPVHYNLSIEPDLERLEFLCEQEVKCVVRKDTKEIVLHSKEISITSATYESLSAIEISYHLVDTTVTIRFNENLPIGAGVLKLSFRGILNGDMAGFYKSGYTDADGNKKVMASTQFEALDARRAFPCWVFGITLSNSYYFRLPCYFVIPHSLNKGRARCEGNFHGGHDHPI